MINTKSTTAKSAVFNSEQEGFKGGQESYGNSNKSLPLLYFCFPYRGVGGVSLLFLRFAEYLQKTGLAQCVLIDYQDGFMAQHCVNPEIRIAIYENAGPKVRVPEEAILIFQSMTPWSIFPNLDVNENTTTFFWNCHPFNLVPVLPGLRRYMQRNRSIGKHILNSLLRSYKTKMCIFVELLLERHALGFMDQTNLENTEFFLDISVVKPVFIPVAIEKEIDAQGVPSKKKSLTNIRITWVGRLVDFKFFPLLRFLYDLNELESSLEVIEVTLVGTGDMASDLKRQIVGLQNIRIRFIEHVEPDQLPSFLSSNTDCLIAMGTSALEGARLGIPTILLDMSYGYVERGYKYRWLHERDGYTLGEVIGQESFSAKHACLDVVLRQLVENSAYLGMRSLKYFLENHDIVQAANMFMSAITKSALKFGELRRTQLLKQDFFYRTLKFLRQKA